MKVGKADRAVTAVPLCVPFARRVEAKAAGAVWQVQERYWACDSSLLRTDAYSRLKPFVPRMYRPDLEGPALRPWLIPSPLWGKNLRAILSTEEWDRVRRHAYEESGRRCRACGGRGPRWPVEADEGFAYDDEGLTHTLMGVIGLCPTCHEVRHWGKTVMKGREQAALDQLMRVNGWSVETAAAAVDEAFERWSWRSEQTWTSDYSWVTRTHGIAIPANADARANAANLQIIGEAPISHTTWPIATDEMTTHDHVRSSVFTPMRRLGKFIGGLFHR